MDKNFSISLDFNNVPTFGEYLQDHPEAQEPEVDEATEVAAPASAITPPVATSPPKTAPAKKSTKKPSSGAASSSQRDIQALMTGIKERLINGESDMAIAEDLNLGKAEYRRLKSKVYDQEVDGFVGKSAEEQFVDYRFEQEKCLIELDGMIKNFSTSNQHNALVGAIRAKSQILDAIRKTGISTGIIKQETSWDREVGGIRISDLDNKELRDAVATELRNLQSYIDKFGDVEMPEVVEPSPMSDPNVIRTKA